jgi:hypothetical protein
MLAIWPEGTYLVEFLAPVLLSKLVILPLTTVPVTSENPDSSVIDSSDSMIVYSGCLIVRLVNLLLYSLTMSSSV